VLGIVTAHGAACEDARVPNLRPQEAIEKLDGSGEIVHRVFFTQERPAWLLPVALTGFVIVYVALSFTSIHDVFRALISALPMGIVYGRGANRGWLALTETRLILTRSTSSNRPPSEIIDTYPVGIEARRGARHITSTYEIGDHKLVLPRSGTDILEQSLTIVH